MKNTIKTNPAEAIARIAATAGESAESILVATYTADGFAAHLYATWSTITDGAIFDLGIEGDRKNDGHMITEAEFNTAERDALAAACNLVGSDNWRDSPYQTASKYSTAYTITPAK